MNTTPGEKTISPSVKAIVIIIVLLIIGSVIGLIIARGGTNYVNKRIEGRPVAEKRFIKEYFQLGTITLTVNIVLLLGLLAVYFETFRKTKSSFMLGLLIFIGVLFLKSVVSFPIVAILLGVSLSIFSLLPFMFESLALVILLYLSMN